jgi:hypothetical protein
MFLKDILVKVIIFHIYKKNDNVTGQNYRFKFNLFLCYKCKQNKKIKLNLFLFYFHQ